MKVFDGRFDGRNQREIERLMEQPEEYEKMKDIAVKKGMKAFSYKEIAAQAIS